MLNKRIKLENMYLSISILRTSILTLILISSNFFRKVKRIAVFADNLRAVFVFVLFFYLFWCWCFFLPALQVTTFLKSSQVTCATWYEKEINC